MLSSKHSAHSSKQTCSQSPSSVSHKSMNSHKSMQSTNRIQPSVNRQRSLDPNSVARQSSHTSVGTTNTAADEGLSFPTTTRAICVKDLHHWCATIWVLLILQFSCDFGHQGFQVSRPSTWCGLALLIYSVVSALAIYYGPSASPYAGYLLAIGSVLMTCQMALHWDSHMGQFKDTIGVESVWPRADMLQNSTAPGSKIASLSSPISSSAFGSSPVEIMDTAMLFVILFENCMQSSFLTRLGVRLTAVVSVVQWLVIVCWPFGNPSTHPAWLCRIVAAGLWTAHLIRSSYVWESDLKQQAQVIDNLQETLAEVSKNLEDRQTADSVLNHILKNTMADAGGCIELFVEESGFTDSDDGLLSKASNILFRGMWWCKLREALLKMVAGRYEAEPSHVDIQRFVRDFVRGRDMEHECPADTVVLDPMVCNIVLDNAVTNAKRHGHPVDPQVKLTVSVTEDTMVLSDECRQLESVKVRFLVTNRANPSRPALQNRWSSQKACAPLPKDSTRPTLSDGLGLQHISMVANASGMVAQLWQVGQEVYFELCLNTMVKPTEVLEVQAVHVAHPFPAGLTIMGLDDSAIARRTLKVNLDRDVPTATTEMYGKDIAEVEEFKQAALQRADILILDENVDLPGNEEAGSAILQELIAAGYKGFACIRSGNSAASDVAQSLAAGAHWHVGKEVPIRDMLQEMRVEYNNFLSREALKEPDEPEVSPSGSLAGMASQVQFAIGAPSSSGPSSSLTRTHNLKTNGVMSAVSSSSPLRRVSLCLPSDSAANSKITSSLGIIGTLTAPNHLEIPRQGEVSFAAESSGAGSVYGSVSFEGFAKI